MKKKRILLLGSNGFIGSNFYKSINIHEYECWTMDFTDRDGDNHLIVSHFTTDFLFESFLTIDPEIVVVAAGVTKRSSDIDSWIDCYEGNDALILKLIQTIQRYKVVNSQPIFLLSLGSQLEYGNKNSIPLNENMRCSPEGQYAVSKLNSTTLIETAINMGICTGTILRLPIVFGANQKGHFLIPDLIKSILLNDEYPMSKGEQLRGFISVGDVVQIMFKVIKESNNVIPPIIMNCLHYPPMSVASIVKKIATIMKYDIVKLKLGTLKYRDNEIMNYWLDHKLICTYISHELQYLDDALLETIESYI